MNVPLDQVTETVDSPAGAFRISGYCSPRFDRVRWQFRENFFQGSEVGACVAAYHEGRCVVDLWGGFTNSAQTKPWEAHTLVNMMSVGKAVTALVVHMLAEKGLLDLDAPVAEYWPEFAVEGKHGVLLRHVLDHRAGLPVLLEPLPRGSLYDFDVMTAALARARPLWEPGTQAGYHILTQGFLLGMVIRKATGFSLPHFVAANVASPWELDLHFGLPDSEFARCATFLPSVGGTIFEQAASQPQSLQGKAWAQMGEGEDFNSAHWRKAEITSANVHANARAFARFFAGLAQGGELNGQRLVSAAMLRRMTAEQHNLVECVMNRSYHQAAGLLRNSPPIVWMGPNPDAFGHHGVGGALGMADPARRLGFAYGMNQMHGRLDNGPRAGGLLAAVYASL